MNILEDKFKIIKSIKIKNNLEKITIDKKDLKACISYLKNAAEFSADILISIIANDLQDKIELIYDLYSTKLNSHMIVATETDSCNPAIDSINEIFKSATYDEREIFDLFGIEFDGHKNLKRLLMPNSTIGNPLLKSYKQNDERLNWNE